MKKSLKFSYKIGRKVFGSKRKEIFKRVKKLAVIPITIVVLSYNSSRGNLKIIAV